MKTRICFIRHGETDWNVAHRIQGQTDVPLNETGRSQALAMAFNAGHYEFSAIVSSDLQRCIDTVQIAAGDRNLVSGQAGTAFGYQNAATGLRAFASGWQDTAIGNNSAVFGTGNTAGSFNEFTLGMYGSNYAPVSTSVYDATDRILNVGNGASAAARADAFTILKGGNVGIGTANPTALLDVNGNTIRVRTSKTPASSSDPGNTGDIAWDSDYIYVCVAANTWKRVAIASW